MLNNSIVRVDNKIQQITNYSVPVSRANIPHIAEKIFQHEKIFERSQ